MEKNQDVLKLLVEHVYLVTHVVKLWPVPVEINGAECHPVQTTFLADG